MPGERAHRPADQILDRTPITSDRTIIEFDLRNWRLRLGAEVKGRLHRPISFLIISVVALFVATVVFIGCRVAGLPAPLIPLIAIVVDAGMLTVGLRFARSRK